MNDLKQMTDVELCAARVSAKMQETDAVAFRRAVDAEITSRYPSNSPEGTITRNNDQYKLKVRYKLNRSLDRSILELDVLPALSATVDRADWPVDYKWTVVVSKLRRFIDKHPDLVPLLSMAMTEKPATPEIQVEKL